MRIVRKTTQYGRGSGRVEKPFGVLGKPVGRANDRGPGVYDNQVTIRRGRR